MRKIQIFMITLVAAVATAFSASADTDKPIAVEQLPAKSQKFLKTYFDGIEVSFAKMETDMFDKSYEVFFTNGSKVEFGRKGDWKEVDCQRNELPKGIVPKQISDFVQQKHPQQKIVKIDRDKRDYEIELNNGVEIKFDLQFRVIGYDN